MYCTNCGKEIKEGNTFCSNCGTKVNTISNESSMDSRKSSQNNSECIRQIIGKNSDYYLGQFEEIKRSGKSKINWASFFLGLLHASYRNVWKNWLCVMRVPLIFEVIVILLAGISLFVQPSFTIILVVAAFGGELWLMVTQILFAKRFNKVYKEHVEQKQEKNDLQADPSIGRAVVGYLAMASMWILIFSILSASVLEGMFSSIDDSDLDYLNEIEDLQFDENDDINQYYDNVDENDWSQDETDFVSSDVDSDADRVYKDIVSDEEFYVRMWGPSAGFSVFIEDDEGFIFAAGIGVSGYLAYVDMRDCRAYWLDDTSACYKDNYTGYELTFHLNEDGTLLLTENMDHPSGLNLSGIYALNSKVEYPDCEFVFPHSDIYEIYESECEGMTALECRIAVNEIYARHGRKFKDEALQNYFDSCTWYNGTIEPEDFTEDMLNGIEQANIQTIRRCESNRSSN